VALGEDLQGITAQAVVTHEYGHHIANRRSNAPWPAVDWGTKRWASYLDVCRMTQSGDFFPGDEERFYELNPGEAFAEDYRVLNERRAGLPETPWRVVSPSFYPDQGTLDALALDVTTPWAGNTTSTYTSVLGPRATGRGFRLATPNDGTFTARLTVPAKTRVVLRVLDPTSGEVLAVDSTTAPSKRVSILLCGQRTLWVQVKRVSGSGPIALTVSKP
jgi:hypothetical protein